MMSVEMERWRVYFENSGEDLWTVIDWALTIAAVNYPSELRLRRDGYAEKLFAPANYPLVANNCEPNSRNEEHHHDLLPDLDTATDVVDPVKRVDPVEEDILRIKQQLQELNDASDEEDIIRALKRLQQMEVTVENLEITGIGRDVNDLKKHTSKRVKSVAKKLVLSWKDLVDKWMDKKQKGSDGQNEEGELVEDKTIKAANKTDLLCSSVSSITHSMQRVDNGDDDMFGCSPDDRQVEDQKYNRNAPPSECSLYNTKLATGYRRDSGQMNYRPESTRTTMAGPTVRIVRAPVSTGATPLTTSKKPPTTTKPIPYSPECESMTEKLEAAKRRLQEGYKQAASVKKQRTVQVMGLEEIPQEGYNRVNNPKPGFNNRKPGQR